MTATVYGPDAANNTPGPTLHVVRPVLLLTLSFPDLQGTLVPPALVIVQLAVPVGLPDPGDAAETTAENEAPLDVMLGLTLELIVTELGEGPTVSLKLAAAEPAYSLEPL